MSDKPPLQSNRPLVHSMTPDENESLDTRIRHRQASVFCEGELLDALKSDLTHGRVLSIYGTGGEGKSFFVRDIYQTVSQQGVWAAQLSSAGISTVPIYLDFYDAESKKTHQNLREVFEALSSRGVFCPRFSVAYHSYLHQQDTPRIVEDYLSDLERCKGDKPFDQFAGRLDWCLCRTGAAVDTIDAIGMLAAGTLGLFAPTHDILEAIMQFRENRAHTRAFEQGTRWFNRVGNYDKQTLLSQMPRLLKEDLLEYLRLNTSTTLLFVVDSFEHLFVQGISGKLSDVGRFICRLTHLPSTVWVIAGRRSLRGREWDNVIRYPIELVDLGKDDTARILDDYGIDDPEVINLVYDFSGGVPLFIDFCASALEYANMETNRSAFNELLRQEGDRRSFFERFVSNMEREERVAVITVSFLREWSVALLQEVLARLMDEVDAVAVAEETKLLSFVTERKSAYQIHESIGEMLRSFPPNSDYDEHAFVRIYSAILDILEHCHNNSDVPQEEGLQTHYILARALYDMSYHIEGIQADWWKPFVGDVDATRMVYVSCLRALRLLRPAKDALEQMLATQDEGSDPWLRLRIELAAVLSLISLDEGRPSYHLQAIKVEKDVYRRLLAQGDQANHALLIRVRNSLGTSHYRIAQREEDIDISLEYHQQNYDEIRAKDPADVEPYETNCLNNYGVSCLRAARLAEAGEAKLGYLTAARDAFTRATEVRTIVLDEHKPATLIAMTNLGIVEQEMGELEEAKARFDHVTRLLSDSSDPVYPKGHARWFYVRFHQALLEESFAQRCLEAGDREGATGHYTQALGLHTNILEDRIAYHAPVTDRLKSEEAIKRCETYLADL